MKKPIRMVLYGEPGVGKSTFAFGAPKPFFITTDPNYEYLEDYFGADAADHRQVTSWADAKNVFSRMDFSKYETIVVDLLEDLYLWADAEFCKDNAIKHISDFGYGKGYTMLGNDFFIEISKLLNMPDKNVILIMHGIASTLKDRRGVEYTKYSPVATVRDKLLSQIEGRVRFFLRAFADTSEDANGILVTKRYLSLSPDGTTEYGIARGLVGDVPRYIPLDWESFYSIATRQPEFKKASSVSTVNVVDTEDEPASVRKPRPRKAVAPAPAPEAPKVVEAPKQAEVSKQGEEPKPLSNDDITAQLNAILAGAAAKQEAAVPKAEPEVQPGPIEKSEPVQEATVSVPPASTAYVPTQAERMAAIKAKLAAIKAAKN